MKRQFVDLFDPDTYGWNISAALWLLAGLSASTCISIGWVIYDVVTFAGADSTESFFQILAAWAQGEPAVDITMPFGKFLLSWGWGFTNSVVLAVALIGLAHALKKDVLLPPCVAAVILNWAALTTLLAGGGFDWSWLLPISAWSFLLSASLVVCYRLVGDKVVSIVLAFSIAAILEQALEYLVYGFPPVEFIFSFDTVLRVLQESLAGLIFGRGIAPTLRRGQRATGGSDAG